MEWYQELFSHMNKHHDLLLLQTEMDDIIDIVRKMLESEIKYNTLEYKCKCGWTGSILRLGYKCPGCEGDSLKRI